MPRPKKKWMQPAVMPTAPVGPVVDQKYFNLQQAAVYMGVTVWTVRNFISTGKLVAKRMGKRFTVRREDIDSLWENQAAA